MLFLNLATLKAAGVSGGVNVSLKVVTPAPTVGAVITSPEHQSKVSKPLLELTGTCLAGSYVLFYTNARLAGSASCQTEGSFQAIIQLQEGNNTVQAQNYDTFDQAGPATDPITVLYDAPILPAPLEVNAPEEIIVQPDLPVLPTPALPAPTCKEIQPNSDVKELTLSIPCITRDVFVGEKIEVPVWISNGIAPYALSVDWGDSEQPTLYSFNAAGRHVVSHTYTLPQTKRLVFRLADASGESYRVEAVMEVNGDSATATTGGGNLITQIADSISRNWLELTVPVYWSIVALFLGFWVGDLFQRYFGAKPQKRLTK
jgi:hypothetical protein